MRLNKLIIIPLWFRSEYSHIAILIKGHIKVTISQKRDFWSLSLAILPSYSLLIY